MKITARQINNALENGYKVTITINGETYELDKLEDFTDGVKFAAAVIQDDRARRNCAFEGLRTIKRISKAAIAANDTRNDEARHTVRKLEYILQNPAPWINDYKAGNLWRLKA